MCLLLDWQGRSYIGGRNVDGIWRWQGIVTSEICYDWWAPNQPSGDGDCIGVNPKMRFNDMLCVSTLNYFFCEKTKS